MAELILKDESFKLMGLMFRAHSQIGPLCKEKNYQDAIEMIFKKENIEFEREKEVYISFEEEKLGGFFIDFLVWDKIILEVKAKPFITHEDIRQVVRYLQATGLFLALLVNFKREKVEYKRVINSNARKINSSQLEKISDKLVKYLGIDWGEKRVGLALADSEINMAMPFKVVGNIEEVLRVIDDEKIEIVIVGKPLSITNHKLQITNEKYNRFIKDLKNKTNLLIKLIDERLSSKASDALIGDKKVKAPRDAVSAMLILQLYLDKNKNK
ncbi:MAG: Holliday junction resolvase RuvX [Patescibacteria group bacterium]